ncbi:RING zinc finger-containing protein [Tieghemostelium lacteum]|uniref:RING zinc finger-containing protein n=1 Tax=Tieghemostelium lacteum TaxID=361077 RepID=A0A152A4Z8_TIELA|nr:RING zinc finger-containing protein [Tieghemostelium lacteum]|eukprot:KYR01135.1 RING zinc finger-containing protein [Tieghemostelium lacteum]
MCFSYSGAFIISKLFALFCALVGYETDAKLDKIAESIEDLRKEMFILNGLVFKVLEENEKRLTKPLSIQEQNNNLISSQSTTAISSDYIGNIIIEANENAKDELKQDENLVRIESDRISKEMAYREELDRVAKVKADKEDSDRIEKAELSRIIKDKLEKEKLLKMENARVAKEKAAKKKAERLARKKEEKERLEKLEYDRIAKEMSEKIKQNKEMEVKRLQEESSGKLVHLTLGRPVIRGRIKPQKRISSNHLVIDSSLTISTFQNNQSIPIPPPLPPVSVKKPVPQKPKKQTPQPKPDEILLKWREDIKKIHSQNPDNNINNNNNYNTNNNSKIKFNNKYKNVVIKNQLKILEEYLPIPIISGVSRDSKENTTTCTTTTTTSSTNPPSITSPESVMINTVATTNVNTTKQTTDEVSSVTASSIVTVSTCIRGLKEDDILMDQIDINNNINNININTISTIQSTNNSSSITKSKLFNNKYKNILNSTRGVNHIELFQSRLKANLENQKAMRRNSLQVQRELSNSLLYQHQQQQQTPPTTPNTTSSTNTNHISQQLDTKSQVAFLLDKLTHHKNTLLSNLKIDEQEADDDYRINFTIPDDMMNDLTKYFNGGLLNDKYKVIRRSTPSQEFSNCHLSVFENDEVYKLIDFNTESIVVLYQDGYSDNDIKIGVVFNHCVSPFDSNDNDQLDD